MKLKLIDPIVINFFQKPIVIIVDDNELINYSNKKIISQILIEFKLDYDIILGNDGLDIIKLILNYENKYNLIKCIFTDENMDFFNGSEAINFARKYENLKHFKRTKIISMTCHEGNVFQGLILKSGADFVVTKPISKSSFINTLQNVGFFDEF